PSGITSVGDLALLSSPALEYREHLAGEGLVLLDQVEIVEGEPGAGEQFRHRGHRADAHRRWLTTGGRPPAQEPHRLQAELVELVLGNDQARGRRVVLLA